jgi:hypothetical protein
MLKKEAGKNHCYSACPNKTQYAGDITCSTDILELYTQKHRYQLLAARAHKN